MRPPSLLCVGHVLCHRAAWGLLSILFIAWSSAALAAESLEYAVKAAYLTKFGIYVEWPGTAFGAPDSPINLCIVGDDPFGTALDQAAANQRVGSRAVMIRRMKVVTRESGCHMLYIGNSDPASMQQTIEALRGSAVLTVTDTRGAETGSIINFVVKDNRVRFDVDEEAAVQNGLALSSKLLSLALNVKSRRQ